jgi:hypothetical protein
MKLLRLDELQREVRRLQNEGSLPTWPTDEQRADWAFGNTVIENESVTFEMARKAAEAKPRRYR